MWHYEVGIYLSRREDVQTYMVSIAAIVCHSLNPYFVDLFVIVSTEKPLWHPLGLLNLQ
jgi:hypothetical protein